MIPVAVAGKAIWDGCPAGRRDEVKRKRVLPKVVVL